jgi:hypothetical protein
MENSLAYTGLKGERIRRNQFGAVSKRVVDAVQFGRRPTVRRAKEIRQCNPDAELPQAFRKGQFSQSDGLS